MALGDIINQEDGFHSGCFFLCVCVYYLFVFFERVSYMLFVC